VKVRVAVRSDVLVLAVTETVTVHLLSDTDPISLVHQDWSEDTPGLEAQVTVIVWDEAVASKESDVGLIEKVTSWVLPPPEDGVEGVAGLSPPQPVRNGIHIMAASANERGLFISLVFSFEFTNKWDPREGSTSLGQNVC